MTHLEGGPSAARCGGSRLGPSRQARLTLSRLCYSICFQSRVKNAGTSTCQKSFKHSPAVSLQPYTHSDPYTHTHTETCREQILPVSAVQTCHHTASQGWLNCKAARRDPIQKPNPGDNTTHHSDKHTDTHTEHSPPHQKWQSMSRMKAGKLQTDRERRETRKKE